MLESLLGEVAARAASFSRETTAIRRAIEPTGEIKDDASPALRDIRDKLRRQRSKLRTTLEGLARGRDTAKYVQDQIITDRHGRYVIVVRSEHREAIPGIVHGTSASGASLYLEPLATVELNNDIVALAEREREEIHRILLALSDAFRYRRGELDATIDAAADLDELYAKTRLATALGGIAPELRDDGRLEFRGARHPLLVLSARADAQRPQPISSDLLIIPPTQALVISGPNTGGKTVALKAMGLLALMAQSGLLIPVEGGSGFTPFRTVFADIGDSQSIAASLSTFSAHLANLVAMDRTLERPALVLLDEVGGGTDPIEGGALGIAVIEHFRRRGALVVATTHDDSLKSYAATTDGVSTAAFGFEANTYAPTYRLVYGAPGRSLALEMAERLGMPASVVAEARSRVTNRESQLAAHLARVDRELAALDEQRRTVDRDREALAGERQRVLERESRLAEREALLARRLDDRLNEKLRDARAEVDRIVGQLKQKADAASARGPRLSTGELGGLKSDARTALDSVSDAFGIDAGATREPAKLDAPPEVGTKVFVAPFGADAIVRQVSGNRIDVDLRGKRLRVNLSDLRVAGATSGPSGATQGKRGSSGGGRVSVETVSRAPGTTRELVLIGRTVDDAIDEATKFLDAALLADERRLRVVHGHGTGKLREAMRRYFREHPLVSSVAPAPDNEGGDGATIVELKD